jgi:serine/threonine-protein kinase
MQEQNIKKTVDTDKKLQDEKDIPLNWKYFAKIFSLLLFLILLTYFLFNMSMQTVIHQRKEVIIPDIKGKSALKALEILSENNLAMQAHGFEFNDSVPVGTVLRQIPQSGITAREGRIIKVIFSQGGESVFVPNLIGLPLRNADLLLRQRQLVLGEVTESYSLKFEKGTVVNQDPKAETGLAKNSMVNLIVSAGPPPAGIVIMPDFRQKKIEDFQKWANGNNIKFQTIEDKNSIFPYGTIIDQYPESDSVLDKEKEVKITMSARGEVNQNVKEFQIKYNVSQSGSQRHIRIVAISKTGDMELFNAIREPGSKIELSIPYNSAEKIRIFVNGILVEERQVKGEK